jgi:hypothetical protein
VVTNRIAITGKTSGVKILICIKSRRIVSSRTEKCPAGYKRKL